VRSSKPMTRAVATRWVKINSWSFRTKNWKRHGRKRAADRSVRRCATNCAATGAAAPRIENNRTIELDRFLVRGQIDPRYYNTPYYIAPGDQVGQEAFAVIRDAMASKGLVGMGRVVLANRERSIMIEPRGNGLLGMTLRYAHEVRSEAEYFSDIPEAPGRNAEHHRAHSRYQAGRV
jgi:hypothetical protein